MNKGINTSFCSPNLFTLQHLKPKKGFREERTRASKSYLARQILFAVSVIIQEEDQTAILEGGCILLQLFVVMLSQMTKLTFWLNPGKVSFMISLLALTVVVLSLTTTICFVFGCNLSIIEMVLGRSNASTTPVKPCFPASILSSKKFTPQKTTGMLENNSPLLLRRNWKASSSEQMITSKWQSLYLTLYNFKFFQVHLCGSLFLGIHVLERKFCSRIVNG